MHWSDIPRNPPTATLRWFAVFCALAVGGCAGWQLVVSDNRALGLALLGLAFFLGSLGALLPALVRPVFVGALLLTFPLNWLFSHLLLGALYYCLFTPLGLFFRLIGRDVLGMRFQPDRDTYWAPKPEAEEIRRYFRQS